MSGGGVSGAGQQSLARQSPGVAQPALNEKLMVASWGSSRPVSGRDSASV